MEEMMMSQLYGVNMDAVLDSVLEEMDEMMLTQIHQTTYTSNPINSNYSSSYNNSTNTPSLTCDVDKLVMTPYSLSTTSYSSVTPNHMDSTPELTDLAIFKPPNDGKLRLKDYIYISKDCKRKLREYIVKENWWKESVLLYKYLDYIFRCQSFDEQIIEINHKNDKNDTNIEYLIFHSGLQRRKDNEFLFVLLIPNNISTKQKWRVNIGGIKNSFLSKNQLLQKLKQDGITIFDHQDLPKRTKFAQSITDLVYDDTYSIKVNWEERLTLNRDRIYKIMGNIAFFDGNKKYLKLRDLIQAFDESLARTQKICENNPRLAVPQGFVDTKHCQYRMELLLPIIVQFPRYHGKCYKFALAIGKSTENAKTYIVKSILTMDMGYANARLVGYVDSIWLINGDKKRKDITNINQLCLNINGCIY